MREISSTPLSSLSRDANIIRNSQPDGYGVFEYRDGRRYEGTWVNGFKHGRGTLYGPARPWGIG